MATDRRYEALLALAPPCSRPGPPHFAEVKMSVPDGEPLLQKAVPQASSRLPFRVPGDARHLVGCVEG